MNPGLLIAGAAGLMLLFSRKKKERAADASFGGEGAPPPAPPPRPGKDAVVGGFAGAGTDKEPPATVTGHVHLPDEEPPTFAPLPEPQVFKFEGVMKKGIPHTVSIGPVPKGRRTAVKVYFQVVLDGRPNEEHQAVNITRILDIDDFGRDKDPNEPYDVTIANDTLSETVGIIKGEKPGWNGEFFNLCEPKLKVANDFLKLTYNTFDVNGPLHYVVNVGVTYHYA